MQGKQIVIRGYTNDMGLQVKDLKLYKKQEFKFSAHTYPTVTTLSRYILDASGGDRLALEIFEQDRSLILDSLGRRNIFDQTDNLTSDIFKLLRQTNQHIKDPHS